ncbi:MAG: aminotransferase class III-fold pyridoxal phosphate-dependent enzyme [Armatimonadetes bacterium]|jgi:putrescine aminotransferase|nr:aminotransferase class III-fold pyridoxal phosphate-dependent enzyme [Armatimonadota bacterium]
MPVSGCKYSPEEVERIADEVLEKYRRHVNPGAANLLRFAGFGVPEWEGEGVYVRDLSGKEYLDFVGGYGVFSLGYRHPRVVAAVQEQLNRLPLKTQYFLSKPVADACALLAEVAPGRLQYTFLCNSGTEAVEGALKCARVFTRRPGIVSAVGAFHGKSLGSLSASGRDVYKEPFQPLVPGFKHVPFGQIEPLREALTEEVGAVILEAVQGEGGVRVPPADYLRQVRAACDEHGVLLILDEVRTGFGRLGSLFAADLYGIEPDVLCLGKALGGGVMPVAAFMAREEIWEAMFAENPWLHSSTFGGSPLAAAAALAAVQTTLDEKLPERAATLEADLLGGLRRVQQRFPEVLADVRGRGLLAGVEFTDPDLAKLVITAMGHHGVLVAYSLNNPCVVRLEPPLIVTADQVAHAVQVFEECIAESLEAVDGLV